MSSKANRAIKNTNIKTEKSGSNGGKSSYPESINSPAHQILFLQQTVGNLALQRLFKSRQIQAKLKIGQPNDIYEQEADRIAEQVMRISEPEHPKYKDGKETIQTKQIAGQIIPLVQRQIESKKAEEEEEIQTKPLEEQITSLVQRQVEQDEGDRKVEVQTRPLHQVANGELEVSEDLENRLTRSKRVGSHLPDEVRAYMEQIFSADFSQVRVHTGSDAAQMNRTLNAQAFTNKQDIYFGAGKSPGNNALTAHELTHVLQQTGGGRLNKGQRRTVDADRLTNNRHGCSMVQLDLANVPPNPQAVAGSLSAAQLRTATRYNRRRFSDPYAIAVIRDVIGISRFPGVINDEFVQAIAQWQAQHNIRPDGRLTSATNATIVAELRAEGRIVPSLLRDAELVQLEPSFNYNNRLGLDRRSIRILQSIIGASASGWWDLQTVRRVVVWQRAHTLAPDGAVGPNTQRSLIMELVGASRFDDAIHVIVDLFNFPVTNLAVIRYDATVAQDAITQGTIGAGQPQTVRVGPSTFTSGYAHMIRIIGHELQHVQQRSAATPILNQNLREFLAYAWEALAEGPPQLTPAQRVNHANIAINHWNLVPAAVRAPHQAVRDRLQQLLAANGVGTF